jgi:DNA polymerase III, delta subunit
VSSRWVREGKASATAAATDDEGLGHRRLLMPLGQGEALQRWVAAARRLVLPHGFAIEGPRGAGKTTVVQWLTAALLCPSELDPDTPCGLCRTCTRIANDQHPDVHVLDLAQDEQERKEWKKSFYVITVDQVRQAQQALGRLAVEGRARVLVVRAADHLDEEGQNALLKTLEEPGERTFLLLEAAIPEQLLPTVRSRVQRLRLLPLADDVLRAELFRRLPTRGDRLPAALAVAGGSLGKALEACTEQVVQIHDLVRTMLQQRDRLRPVATARAVLAEVPERRLELSAARTFLWLLRAELVAERRTLAAAADGSYPAVAEPWTTWLELTLAAERDLDLMIPPEQVLTACLLQFTGS